MADGLVLLEDGLVVLGIFAVAACAPAAFAALVDEELGQVEVFRVAGDAVELDQADLDLLVAGDALELFFARAEGPDEEVGVLDGDVQESCVLPVAWKWATAASYMWPTL